MTLTQKLLPPLALVGALALVPVATSSLAASDVANYKELEKFMSVYERVKGAYVEPVDDATLIRGAIDGMLAALDPHSGFVEDGAFDSLRTTTDGNYGGLGLSVSIEDGAVKVIAPTEDTPAWRAGIKAGDYITHINGELLYGLNLDEAVEWVANHLPFEVSAQLSHDDVHVGPSDHVPWLTDRKWAYIRMEGTTFGDVPLNVEVKLEVWDSPNSAGVMIDAIRCARIALDRKMAGPLVGPSSYFFKTPPKQFRDEVCREKVEAFINGDGKE